MNTEDQILRLLFQRHVKPLLREVLQEFLAENSLAIISKKPTDPSLINTKTAAKHLGGISRQTLYRYIREGLPTFRVGKTHKFRIEDIEAFVSQKMGVK
jgi:excisionase family DNA binding protein